jgi:Asp-tRNA(Asn)/Glu-tRNA(Gln) amidotransferase A subunit family amidase
MRTAQLWQLPATELAGLVGAREISAREAVQSALDRLDDVNGAINAVVDHRPRQALAAADVIDARLRNGGEVGALAGVPVTVKVNVDQAGYATTEGVTLQPLPSPCGGLLPTGCTAKHEIHGTSALPRAARPVAPPPP